MNSETFKMTAHEVFSEAVRTFKNRILVLMQAAIFSGILAIALLGLMGFYVAFSSYVNWMILGATTVVAANYILTGQVCGICEKVVQGIVNLARFFRRKIFTTEQKN